MTKKIKNLILSVVASLVLALPISLASVGISGGQVAKATINDYKNTSSSIGDIFDLIDYDKIKDDYLNGRLPAQNDPKPGYPALSRPPASLVPVK